MSDLSYILFMESNDIIFAKASNWDNFIETQVKLGRIKAAQPKRSMREVVEKLPPLPAGIDLLRQLIEERESARY